MVRESERRPSTRSQNDPGESNDPRSSSGDFDGHIWSSLNQIFERLGKMDQKLDQLATQQGELKGTVEKHDKLIMRGIFAVGGMLTILGILWFVYDHFLKSHLVFK